MKKIILLTTVWLLGTLTYAQNLHVTDDSLDKQVLALSMDGPAMATLEMQQELQLTNQQLEQVTRLNQERYAQLQQAERSFADPVERAKQVRTIYLDSDKALHQVLTPAQLHQFLELEGRQNIHFVSENDKL
ncbi:hypothetical protein [Pontibacter chitinilyticus]|uniref:hypothetical protein n=1 Tax=Pontibacter chitinilyticus TaxID=2674989 RepID=UPI00321C34C9